MPDTKITALAAITTVAPANDLFAIVDVSDNSMAASGTTKNITTNQILGAGGTATLASATITGDLTVRTNKLFVNATGVGIGTTSVLGDFTIQNGSNCRFEVTSSATGTVIENLNNARNAYLNMTMYADAYIWNRLGSEAMRLNSTGLGVGVTPSAWDTANYKALQVSRTAVASLSNIGIFAANWFADTGGDKYIANGTAARIDVNNSGQIQFKIAPSGTAGNAITFTQAMTLDASGNLLVGTTSPNTTWSTKLTLSSDSGTTKWAVGPYGSGGTFFMVSAGGSTGVYLNGTSATSWTSASDERLKDIIEPISNAVSKVASLRAVIGKFKFDENNTRKPFLIAQDIQAVLPEAVDASNPDRLGVSYTDVIPLLVAAIKELTARVQTLEAK